MSQVRERGNKGYPQTDPAVYQEMVRLFHQNGVPVGTHAVGDCAIDWVVDTYALVEQEQPRSGLRHSVIHANLPTPHALDVMANLQRKYEAGYPEMQPGFLWWIGDIYAASYGPKRGQRLEPFRTLQSPFSGPAGQTTPSPQWPHASDSGPPKRAPNR